MAVLPVPAEFILDRVRAIPLGFVRTYGDLCPAAPRRAGAVLAGCHDPSVPWQRVVRADGSLAMGTPQRALLEAEGVPFGARASTCAWHDARPMWLQREIRLEPRPRGFHLVTREVESALPELAELEVGLCHLFLAHTSAALTLNENASPDVRRDLRAWFDTAVREDFAWEHSFEGPDDMPAHVASSLLGASLSLPVRRGRLALGTWQGITLCEARDHGGARSVVATLWGQSRREAP